MSRIELVFLLILFQPSSWSDERTHARNGRRPRPPSSVRKKKGEGGALFTQRKKKEKEEGGGGNPN